MKSSTFWLCLPHAFTLVSCFGLFFDPKDGDDMYLRNVSWLSVDYAELYPRKRTLKNWWCSMLSLCNLEVTFDRKRPTLTLDVTNTKLHLNLSDSYRDKTYGWAYYSLKFLWTYFWTRAHWIFLNYESLNPFTSILKSSKQFYVASTRRTSLFLYPRRSLAPLKQPRVLYRA
jgi:hypothetical protein